MSGSAQISAPGGFVPEHAIVYSGGDGAAVQVGAGNPLPIASVVAAATSTPLAGTATTSGSLGPFAPQLGRTIWLTLSGGWSGSVQVARSTDGGTTKLPLTAAGASWASFSGNANEAIGEESVAAARYYLVVALTSGSLTYLVQQ